MIVAYIKQELQLDVRCTYSDVLVRAPQFCFEEPKAPVRWELQDPKEAWELLWAHRESGLRGKSGCHAGLRFDECIRQHALFPMVDMLGLATALRAATAIIKNVFVFLQQSGAGRSL